MEHNNEQELVEDYWEEAPENDGDDYQMGFQEMGERARGGAQVMGGVIEGGGKLAKIQEMIERRQKGTQMERNFLSSFMSVSEKYRLGEDDEVLLRDMFVKLKHAAYKNATAFILAYIALQNQRNLKKEGLRVATKIAAKLDAPIMEEDIIRYARLILLS